MNESTPSLDQWHSLYGAVDHLKEVAPWEWMTEADVFGVQDPETGTLGFVSIMGMLGEHLALALYLGAEGLYAFWAFQEDPDSMPPEILLSIPHLQASFEDRATLTQKDRDTIKQLGLTYRGKQAWPMFRSYRPGYFPWYLETWEAEFLNHALQQAVEVALRFKENPELLNALDGLNYLVRVPREEGGTLVWEDQVMEIPPPEPQPIPIPMDMEALEAVRQLPSTQHTLEVGLSMLPVPIGDPDERPYYPYLLLVVEPASRQILAANLLQPESPVEHTWGQVAVHLVYLFRRMEVVPQQIHVPVDLLGGVIEPLANELGFEVRVNPQLPALEETREFLIQRFGEMGEE